MNIAIVGSTGNVGRKLIEVLEKKNFPVTEAFLVASSKSSGKKINFLGKEHTVENLEKFDFSKVKIAFFAAGSSVAERWAPIAAKNTIVIERANDQFDIDYLFYCLSIKGALFQEGGAQPFISQKEIIKTDNCK